MKEKLPRTGSDIMRLSPSDWLIYHGTIAFRRATGTWRYPVPTNGDYEFMKRIDMIYWVFKSITPLMNAERNSGLEEFFRAQGSFEWELPAGFRAQSILRLSAVGDLLNHPYLRASGDCLYEAVDDLVFDSDVSMANLECVITGHSDPLNFDPSQSSPLISYTKSDFDAAKGKDRRYTFLTTANNHSLDFGESGVNTTMRTLSEEDIRFGGMNESEADAVRVPLIQKKGIRLGLICHTFGLNGKRPPPGKPWLVNRTPFLRKVDDIDFSLIRKQIAFCRDQNADLIVAQLHWGLEFEYFPRVIQVELGHFLAELGVDVIIGHHPHVAQPVEFYRTRRDPDRVVPIFYSLGNLISIFSNPATRESGVARLEVAKGVLADGTVKTLIKDARMRTVYQDVDVQERKIRLIDSTHLETDLSRIGVKRPPV